MARYDVLNPQPRPAELEAVELSRAILASARSAAAGRRDGSAAPSAQLHGVDPATIGGDDARIAFWLNLYNALLLERLARDPIAGSMLRHPRLFSRTAYAVGGRPHSLNLIEHGILRRNRRPPYHPRRPLRRGDPRLRALPSRLDPRIHFALNCGARSCPPIRPYAPATLDEDLEAATAAYLAAETEVAADGRAVVLPRLMRLYRRDFGGRGAQLAFAAARLPLPDPAGAGARRRVSYGRFDWTAVPQRRR